MAKLQKRDEAEAVASVPSKFYKIFWADFPPEEDIIGPNPEQIKQKTFLSENFIMHTKTIRGLPHSKNLR